MMSRLLTKIARCCRAVAVRAAHQALIARLRLEREIARVARRRRAPRVVATACWTFPVYSQTFVYQEVAGLARSGFAVRFFYSHRGSRSSLAHQCADLWPLKRRVVLDAACGAADYAWFRRRMPDRVETLLTAIGNAAGLSRDVLERHEHLLHAFSFARAVEAWGPDYLHSYFFYERTLFALVASKLLDIPRGVSCYADHQLDDYPLKIVPLHLRTSDVIVATSQRIRGELEVIHGGSLSALLVKPNAIDVSGSPPRPSRPIAPPSPVQLICVCRIDPKKGLEFLIDAVRRLIDDGLDVRLQVVGVPDGHSPAAGAYHDALRSQVDRLGLDHAIRFAGRRTSQEVGELLRRADVFVAPFVELACGDKDGISTAVLEAMSVGCAIVATDAGSLAEVIRDGHDGLLVPQRDSAALAAAIQRLAADAALSDRLGTAAAARVRREFNTATCETPFHERILRTIETPRGTAAPAEVRT